MATVEFNILDWLSNNQNYMLLGIIIIVLGYIIIKRIRTKKALSITQDNECFTFKTMRAPKAITKKNSTEDQIQELQQELIKQIKNEIKEIEKKGKELILKDEKWRMDYTNEILQANMTLQDRHEELSQKLKELGE